MKKFEVEIKEVLTKTVMVEAENEGAAQDLVQAMYDKEEIVLDESDFQGETSIEVLGEL